MKYIDDPELGKVPVYEDTDTEAEIKAAEDELEENVGALETKDSELLPI